LLRIAELESGILKFKFQKIDYWNLILRGFYITEFECMCLKMSNFSKKYIANSNEEKSSVTAIAGVL